MDYELLRAALDTACAEKVAQSDEDTNGYRYDACGKKMDGCGKGKGKGECKGKECDSCKKASCDGCKVKDACGGKKCSTPTLDAIAVALDFVKKEASLTAVSAVQSWVDDSFEDEDGYAKGLTDLVIAASTDDENGEMNEEEADFANGVLEEIFRYFIEKGVSEEDAQAVLSGDEDAASRVRDYLTQEMPDGKDGESDEALSFAFSDEDQEPMMDAVMARKGYKGPMTRKVMTKGGPKIVRLQPYKAHAISSAKRAAGKRLGRNRAAHRQAAITRGKGIRLGLYPKFRR